MKIKNLIALVTSVFALSANSATLLIDSNTGQLMGANGVDVDGDFYNVSFLDGTCNALFSGCSAFTFTTAGQATIASQALLDQVFIDRDDTVPSLTNGITADTGHIATVFGPRQGGTLDLVAAVNNPTTMPDVVINETIAGFASLTFVDDHVFAVWAPQAVPLPAGVWLFGSAVFGLCVAQRRKARGLSQTT